MTDQNEPELSETERFAEERRAALTAFARATAAALQSAVQFASQSEQSLATSITALIDEGLTLDEVAVRIGLRREYVEQLMNGGRITLLFL